MFFQCCFNVLSMFFQCSFSFFQFLSFSFIFRHSLSFLLFSFRFLSFSFIVFFPFFFLLVLLLFSGAQNPLFLPRLPDDFLLKVFCKISLFGPSRGVPHWALFFFSCLFFHLTHFRFLFQFLSMLFLFFICFSFLHFLFLYFPFVSSFKRCFFLFHFASLFFLGCSKSVAALQDSLGKSAHSELALLALYWLVVTFPCGIVHIMVMIRLRVVCGWRRVGQVLRSYQNRQISALDETADAPQSGLFSLLSSSQFF